MDLGLEVSKGVAGKFVQAALGFAGTLLFARILGPAEFGGFYLLLSIVEIVDKPIVGGWATAAKKRFSEVNNSREAVVGSQVLFNIAMIAVVTVGALAFRGFLTDYTGFEHPVVLFLVLFVPIIFFYPFQRMLFAKGMAGRPVAIDTIRSAFTLPLQLGAVLIGLGGAGMAFGLGTATTLVLPLTYYCLRTRPVIPNRSEIASLWRFARHSIPMAMVSKVFDRYDMLLLGLLVGQAATGDYKVALTLTVPAMFVANIGGSALMPKVSNLASRNREVGQEITNALSFSSILSIPIFFGALSIPRPLVVTAYGPEYADAAILLIGLALYRVVQTQSHLLQSTINGLDRPDLTFKISAATLALNIVMGYLLVLMIGAPGVVVATIVAEALRYGLCFVALQGFVSEINLLPRPLFEQFAAGVLMFGAVVGLRVVVPLNSWLTLLIVVAGGGLVYSSVLFVVSNQVRALSARLASALLGSVQRRVTRH